VEADATTRSIQEKKLQLQLPPVVLSESIRERPVVNQPTTVNMQVVFSDFLERTGKKYSHNYSRYPLVIFKFADFLSGSLQNIQKFAQIQRRWQNNTAIMNDFVMIRIVVIVLR